MFRTPLCFNADPDPAFYLSADPDLDPYPGSQTNVDSDSDSGQTLLSLKLDFDEKYLLGNTVCNKTYLRRY